MFIEIFCDYLSAFSSSTSILDYDDDFNKSILTFLLTFFRL